MKKPKIGETYYYVPYDSRDNHQELVVTSIGTKYFYTTHRHKFDKGSYIENCGEYSPSGAVYDNKEAYETHKTIIQCRKALKEEMIHLLSDDDTLEIFELVKNKISNYEKD